MYSTVEAILFFSRSCLHSDNDIQGSCVRLLYLITFMLILHPQTILFSDRVLMVLFCFASHDLGKTPWVEGSVDNDWHTQSLNLVPEPVPRHHLWVEREF